MDNQEPNNNQNNNRNNRNGQVIMTFILISLFALFIISFVSNKLTQQFNQEISYTDFLAKVEADEVESIKYTGSEIDITLKSKGTSVYKQTYYTGMVSDDELIPLLKEHNVEIYG